MKWPLRSETEIPASGIVLVEFLVPPAQILLEKSDREHAGGEDLSARFRYLEALSLPNVFLLASVSPLILRYLAQGVVAEGLCRIRGIQVDKLRSPFFGNALGEPRHEIAMRIKDGTAAASPDVLKHERFEKGRLAGPGLSDGIQVEEPVGLPDAETLRGESGIGLGEEGDVMG